MKNSDFENQYFNFWAAYGAAYVGFKIFECDGMISLSIIFFALSLVVFIYIFRITIKRLHKRIMDKNISIYIGIMQYIFELASCFIMCIFLIEMIDVGKKFWKLRLF